LIGLGALAIPGVGPIIAAGPIAAALAGAGVGAVTGGLIGALVDAGIPEEEANIYSEGVRRGGTLVMVNASDDRASEVARIMERFNPVNVDERSAEWEQAGWERFGQTTATGTTGLNVGETRYDTTTDMDKTRFDRTTDMDETRFDRTSEMDETRYNQTTRADETTLPVIEEEMRVGKREVQGGGVRIHTRMTETPIEEQVTLREERVEVERRPVDRPATTADLDTFKEGTFEVTEKREEAVVDKQARVVEEIDVHKDVEERPETIRGTVRRTDVDVENLGTTGQERMTSAQTFDTFDTFDMNFRNHYQTTYTGSDMTYEDYRPAYRYGYDLGTSDRFRDRDWYDVEREARQAWERTNPDNPWEKFKDAVQQGWDSVHGRR
jgi:uncharacterized protein (TIGR02271 family)